MELLYRLRDVKHIILAQREDCAAYGGSAAFGSPQEARRFQAAPLRRGSQRLRFVFPRAVVESFSAYRESDRAGCALIAAAANAV